MQLDLLSHYDRSSLTSDDWNTLTNIRNAYEEDCVQPFVSSHQSIPLIPPKQPYRSRIKLQRLVDLKYKYVAVIASFIKRILRLDTFSVSVDRDFAFLKDSFQCLITTTACELLKSRVLDCVPWEHDRLAFEAVLTEGTVQRLEEILNIFRSMLPQDPIVMKLFIIAIALSTRVLPLMEKSEYTENDFAPFPKSIVLSQNYYVTLLWKYLCYRVGYADAVIFSARFIQTFLRRQELENDSTTIVQKRDDHGELLHLTHTSMRL